MTAITTAADRLLIVRGAPGTGKRFTKRLARGTWRVYLSYPGVEGFKKSRSKPPMLNKRLPQCMPSAKRYSTFSRIKRAHTLRRFAN